MTENEESKVLSFKGLSFAVILAFLAQFGTTIWWAAGLNAEVKSLRESTDRLISSQKATDNEIEKIKIESASYTQQLRQNSSMLVAMQQDVREVKDLLVQLLRSEPSF